MSEAREEGPALAGHEALFADQTGAQRKVEKAFGSLPGEVDRAIAIAVGKQAGKTAFEFWHLGCLHLRHWNAGRARGQKRLLRWAVAYRGDFLCQQINSNI